MASAVEFINDMTWHALKCSNILWLRLIIICWTIYHPILDYEKLSGNPVTLQQHSDLFQPTAALKLSYFLLSNKFLIRRYSLNLGSSLFHPHLITLTLSLTTMFDTNKNTMKTTTCREMFDFCNFLFPFQIPLTCKLWIFAYHYTSVILCIYKILFWIKSNLQYF